MYTEAGLCYSTMNMHLLFSVSDRKKGILANTVKCEAKTSGNDYKWSECRAEDECSIMIKTNNFPGDNNVTIVSNVKKQNPLTFM